MDASSAISSLVTFVTWPSVGCSALDEDKLAEPCEKAPVRT